jgi:hypothetical protein
MWRKDSLVEIKDSPPISWLTRANSQVPFVWSGSNLLTPMLYSLSPSFIESSWLRLSSLNSSSRAWTMSPEQSQYIWRKTISHIEVGKGSGVWTSHHSARFVLMVDWETKRKKTKKKKWANPPETNHTTLFMRICRWCVEVDDLNVKVLGRSMCLYLHRAGSRPAWSTICFAVWDVKSKNPRTIAISRCCRNWKKFLSSLLKYYSALWGRRSRRKVTSIRTPFVNLGSDSDAVLESAHTQFW